MKRKLYFYLLCLFIYSTTWAQTAKLAKLSEGKLVYYTPLLDAYSEKELGLYGYFFIFNKDRTQRTEYNYEYVLLDKNLNKVFSGEFSEQYNKGINTRKYFEGWYINKQVLLNVYEDGDKMKNRNRWQRLIDLKTNKVSDPFYVNDSQSNFPIDIGKNSNAFYYSLFPYSQTGFFYNNFKWPYPLCFYKELKPGEPTWCLKNSKQNKQTLKKYTDFWLSPVNEEIGLLEEKNIKETSSKKILDLRYKLINMKDGSTITTLSIPDPEKKDSIINGLNKNLQFHFNTYGNIEDNLLKVSKTNFSDRVINPDPFKIIVKEYYSLDTGKKVKTDIFNLKDLSSFMNYTPDYKVMNNGKKWELKLIEHLKLINNNSILIFEETNQNSEKSEFGNLYFVELNKDLKVIKFTKTNIKSRIFTKKEDQQEIIENTRKKLSDLGISISVSESWLKKLPLEDIEFTKQIEDGTIVIFYKQKNEEGKINTLSSLSYKDGKIKQLPDFPIKTEEGSKISFLPAKNGYLLLYEEFEDENKMPELRLEKINY
ncbi:hypothetical protein ETU08_05720 [Apibacter muscae]|uniref:hypothetical protein n=1 Tax=Apibacter muscae TaxID=2509004 RepID=UPI0011AD4025|nr:hypothetical protein [Apibacter muscae]TWP30056.1 hypothetical protein ETU08_05720 [Apibacter muscae]